MGKLWGREVSVSGEAVGEEVSVGGEAVGGGHCPEETVNIFVVTILTCKACYHNHGMRTL